MRKTAALAIVALAIVACGQDAASEQPGSGATITANTLLVDAPPWEPVIDDRPTYQGFGSLSQETSQLVAVVKGQIQVFETASTDSPKLTLEAKTILRTRTVLAVIEEVSEDWVEVLLPVRPNGSTGFVRSQDVYLYAIDGLITVDLSDRTLTYTIGDDEIVSTTVAIGSPANPTPTGSFYITDNVTLSNPNSPWGPHAFGLSARSETITEFNGGDGIIGIHGTNNAASIGDAASLGCVRLPNDVITLLHGIVPIGTPVEIRA